MRTAKTLIRLGGCPGWSESSLGAHAILLVLSWGGSNKNTNQDYLYNGNCDQTDIKNRIFMNLDWTPIFSSQNSDKFYKTKLHSSSIEGHWVRNSVLFGQLTAINKLFLSVFRCTQIERACAVSRLTMARIAVGVSANISVFSTFFHERWTAPYFIAYPAFC